MRQLVVGFCFLASLISFSQSFAADDCACEDVQCNPCELQVDIDLYTAKCDGGKRVKSCKRPICKMMSPLPPMCKNAKQSPRYKKNRLPASKKLKKMSFKKVHRMAHKRGRPIGYVITKIGDAWVTRGSGKIAKAKLGQKVYTSDMLETGEKGKLRIMFNDKNVVNITPKTKMKLTDYKSENKPSDRTLIDLVHGKIRSKVNKKYLGKDKNYYRVRTRAAVAGVRGTDFVISYYEDNDSETKIETFEGLVAMAPRQDKEDEGALLEDINQQMKVAKIGEGQTAKYVIGRDTMKHNVFTDDDIRDFVAKGYMSAVRNMAQNDIKMLDAQTEFRGLKGRDIATDAGEPICSSPSAAFNSCQWKCVGGRGSKCDTTRAGVSCVRKRCDANGRWTQDYRLPASMGQKCHGQKTIVAPCDY